MARTADRGKESRKNGRIRSLDYHTDAFFCKAAESLTQEPNRPFMQLTRIEKATTSLQVLLRTSLSFTNVTTTTTTEYIY